jgi:hypothetical protein
MQLFIPTIGTKLVLTEPWSFDLRQEHRNHAMIQAVRGEPQTRYWDSWQTIDWERQGRIVGDYTLPVGTVLAVDRIYIRKTLQDFDSITFNIEDCPDPRFRSKKMKGLYKGKPRFWVRLDDANKIICDLVPEATTDEPTP